MSGPAFPPIPDADWPEALDDLKGGFATGLDVYRVMAHRPELLRAWAPLRRHVVQETALGAELSEVAILRTGQRLGSDYEGAHHIVRARKIGMADARIASILGPLEAMSETDRVIAAAVDAIFDRHRLDPGQQAAVIDLVGSAGLFDLIATVGFYRVLGTMLLSFETPVDEGIAAALAARPLEPE
ncbi:carboxymuconolactone decarboxylase family protein [Litorisediminicola beolgyonensis]|uniref:Carboxymuconolactone decarboxylase family protein n=1 Tax=Litorisediminicola beolgyonensis TaxID=1173614 RepID=A0ABW3ZQ97_9RHOB